MTMLSKGTHNDKINSLGMLSQKHPDRSLSWITSLMQLARKKNRKQAENALSVLRDVFAKHVLKDDKKLEGFQHNPAIKDKDEGSIA
mmetsp:Transcript_5700/g.9041  ORF Transcript_5700/g.9041 Transcript_5700/m.9041 type:complete len:87 (+) Transcript_5700:302-562(+)